MMSLELAAAIGAAYLMGSIPFGLLIARYGHGIDVRQHGSGNIGATNVGRVLGKKWGVFCLLLDFLKGCLPTLLLPRLVAIPESAGHAALACGAAAIVGHIFPVWLGFRGGKGVATGAGVAAVLAWPAALAALAVFAVTLAAKRLVSLSSIVASIVYAAVTLVRLGEPWSRENWPTAVFALAIPTLIIVRHRDNIRRLLRGEEARYTLSDRHSVSNEPTANAERDVVN